MLRYTQNAGKNRNQGKVKNEKDDVADVHAGQHSPENFWPLAHEKRTGLNSVDGKGSQKHSRTRGKGHSQGQERNHGSGSGAVVCRLRPGHPFNRPAAKFFGVF